MRKTRKNRLMTSSVMRKVIYEHAVDNYIERVLKDAPDYQEGDVRMYAKSRICQTVDHPDQVVEKDDGRPQVHLKDSMAVIVGVPHHGEGKYRPYREDDEKVYIPTVYNRETFDIDERVRKERT